MELRRMRALLDAREVLDVMIVEQVAIARADAASWTDVGRAMGNVTRQGAQRRFGSAISRLRRVPLPSRI
jgi:hypothetical protein